MSKESAVIEVQGLSKTYGGAAGGQQVSALREVDLEIAAGGFVAIMGASGSGKSSLLHILAGLTAPSQGSVTVAGQDLAGLDDQALTLFRRRQLGIVFQAFNLVPVLTALENVALPLTLDGMAPAAAQAKAAALLQQVGLSDRVGHLPDQLSGGEQQRVAFARALVADPAVVLADEPTGNLDSATTRHIGALLRQLHDEGTRSIVLVTHEADVASLADEVIVLADGQVAGRFATEGLDTTGVAERYLQIAGTGASA